MKKTFTDQLNRRVTFDFPPKRIISLVPSQTELLFHLGLEKQVVGITKFCIHPEEQFRETTKIGGTKTLNFDKIAALQPDLIIGNKEENEKTQIEKLEQQFPVWMSDIYDFEDALEMIVQIGKLSNRHEKATALRQSLEQSFSAFSEKSKRVSKKSAAYFIWRKPFMVAADNTFINQMLKIAGFENVFENRDRYPSVTAEELAKAAPEVILLSSEPYPFKEKHLAEMREICPQATVKLVDGEIFSWYGNRLMFAVRYFETLRKELWQI